MEVTFFAEKIGHIGSLPLTNGLLTTWIVMAVLIIFAYFAGKNVQTIPGKLQNFAELILDTLYQTYASISDEARAKRFFPLLTSFFLFILAGNYLGLLPGVGSIGFHEVHDGHEVFIPLLRSMNSDLNATLTLSIVSVIMTHYYAVTTLGPLDYLKRYFSFNPINLFVGLLEIIAEITKVLSLSLRLFGNIFAGEALLFTISAIFAFVLPLPFMFLEIIVGFVQATVFMMLTLVFMSILTDKHLSH